MILVAYAVTSVPTTSLMVTSKITTQAMDGVGCTSGQKIQTVSATIIFVLNS